MRKIESKQEFEETIQKEASVVYISVVLIHPTSCSMNITWDVCYMLFAFYLILIKMRISTPRLLILIIKSRILPI